MTKADRIPLAALMVLAFALWIPWMRGPIDLRWDAGVYYILGTSLAQGKGYRLLNEPGDPQADQYPPLFPLFIAAQQRLLRTSDPIIVGKWLRWVNQLMLMGCAALTYVLARRWVSRWLAFFAGVMFLFSVQTYFMGSLACPEMAFELATLLFLLPGRSSRIGYIWSGVWSITAYLLRTIGIALLATWVAEAALRARWKVATMRAGMAIVPLLLWQGYVHRVEASRDYQHPAYTYQRASYQFYNVSYSRNLAYVDPYRPELGFITAGQLARRTVANLLLERRSFPEVVTTSLVFWDKIHWWLRPLVPIRVFHLVETAASYTIATLMLIGLVLMILRDELRIPLYIVFSALAIAATPWADQFSRYFWALSPLLAIAFTVGVAQVRTWVGSVDRPTCRRMSSVLLTLLVGAAILVESAITVFNWVRPDLRDATYVDAHNRVHTYRLLYYDQRWQNFDRATDWIKQRTAPDAVVATSCAHYVYLRSGHRAVMPPMEGQPAKVGLLLNSVPAAYLVADDLGLMEDVATTAAESVTHLYPVQWKIATITQDPKIVVYRGIRSVAPVHSPYASSSIPRYP